MRKQCVEGRSTSTSAFGSNGNKTKTDPPKSYAIQETKIQRNIHQSHHANSIEFSSISYFWKSSSWIQIGQTIPAKLAKMKPSPRRDIEGNPETVAEGQKAGLRKVFQ